MSWKEQQDWEGRERERVVSQIMFAFEIVFFKVDYKMKIRVWGSMDGFNCRPDVDLKNDNKKQSTYVCVKSGEMFFLQGRHPYR